MMMIKSNFNYLEQKFGRFLVDYVASKGVSGNDLNSWTGALAVINDAISDVQV